jgi:hypothetical protein
MRHTNIILVGGWCLVAFALLFVGITICLDFIAQNQPLLFGVRRHGLFDVMAGTNAVHALLIIYSIVPALIFPGAMGTYYAFSDTQEAQMRLGMHFATLGAFALMLSLMMLPSIHWILTAYLLSVEPAHQPELIAVLNAMHNYFGIFVGDILGVGCLLVWFLISSLAIMRTNVMPHPVGFIELMIALGGITVILLRYLGIMPDIHFAIQINGIIALWTFILGIGLISLRNE